MAFITIFILLKKIVSYRAYTKYIRAGYTNVDDPEVLDILANVCEEMKVTTLIDLHENSLVLSPLLLGLRKLTIVLSSIPEDKEILRCIFQHELMHYKRKGIVYIWVTQVVMAIHSLYHMQKILILDCEFVCDEQKRHL